MMLVLSQIFYSFKNRVEIKTSFVSFYHDKFNGKKTASGEIFDNSKLTAAHQKLPFGTFVRITNPKNGKNIVVKVNDRGPFHSKRAFDISKAAFDSIGDPRTGSMLVEYEVMD